jgi:hypothetical protein
MKTYTIAPKPKLAMPGLLSTYVAGFGILWLFFEPLGAFGLIPDDAKLKGIYLYALLLITPALFTLPLFRWNRWYKTHRIPFIRLSIRSSLDGATYSVKVAENMLVAEFLREYLKILHRGPARSSVEAIRLRYYPVLQVARDGKLIDIDGNLTLHAAEIKDGDNCEVRAEPYHDMQDIRFRLNKR